MSIKKTVFALLLAFTITIFTASLFIVNARVSVGGYYRSNGTYVQPYYRSSPNVYKWDNYSYSYSQPRYNSSYYNRSYSFDSPLYTPDYSYRWYQGW